MAGKYCVLLILKSYVGTGDVGRSGERLVSQISVCASHPLEGYS